MRIHTGRSLVYGIAAVSLGLIACDESLIDPTDGPPEAVVVVVSVDGLTITASWSEAHGATSYRAELFGNPPIGKETTETQIRFTQAEGVLANTEYTVTVFSINQHGETRSTNSPTVGT
jgi:hypothetical protein